MPQVLGQHGQLAAVLIGGRRQVLVLVGTDVLHAVDELHVVGFQEVHLTERVKREGVLGAVQRIVVGIENGSCELIVLTGCQLEHDGYGQHHQHRESTFHNRRQILLVVVFNFTGTGKAQFLTSTTGCS